MPYENGGQTIDRPAGPAAAIATRLEPVRATEVVVQTTKLGPIAAILFSSGMCGLIYQVAWLREFRLLFGASTAASSAVLAVFMGGLGIGNAILGRRADRTSRPLAFYAKLEFSIAIAAAASPLLIDILHGVYIRLGGQLTLGAALATIVRLTTSVLVLGLPTFLMGGTLPAAVRAATVREDVQRRAAALLYGMNTLGAVIGCLASTFFALEFFGIRETLWSACLLNACTAFAALALSRRASSQSSARQPTPDVFDENYGRGRQLSRRARKIEKPTVARENPRRANGAATTVRSAIERAGLMPPPAYVIYGVAGIAGFSFFLMELVWYRMLGPILGGTTFTFGLILAVALTGIGLGGAAYAVLFRRGPSSLHSLALTCVLEALAIALTFALGDRLAVLAARLREASAANFFGEVAGWALVAAIVILPAALVSGVQFAILIAMLGQADKEISKQVGFTFGWNTAGAILGALAGGFGIMPLLSAPGVWRSVAVLLAALGVFLATYSCRMAWRRLWPIATLCAAIVAAMCTCPGPTAVWRHGAVGTGRGMWTQILATPNSVRDWENSVRRSVLWEADGVESSIAVVVSDSLAFYVNGMCDGNAIADAGTQMMLGLIGGTLHPHPRTAFVVGLGTGETAGWLAKVPSVERVDVVELEPAVQEMARRCRAVNQDVLSNPKVRLIFNDAREVLLTTPERYDLIACEPSNPYRSGIANLFTQEFYVAGRDRLNEGGTFAQWLQAYEVDERTVRTVFATFKSVFPHVEIWQTSGGDLVLLGANQRSAYSATGLRQRLATEPFASALPRAWHTTGLEGFMSHFVGGPALVDHFIRAAAPTINTDNRNEIEYACARNLGRTTWDAPRVLYRQAVEVGDERPKIVDGDVDWRAVALSRLWDAAVCDGKSFSKDELSIDRSSEDALERYFARDARGVLLAWEMAPTSTPCLTELATIAHLYAESGSSKAEPLIERLRQHEPSEAEALSAVLAWRQHRTNESCERLANLMRRLRSDPWILAHILQKTFDVATGVAKADPTQAPALLEMFEEPFSVSLADEDRRAAACVIAEQISPAAVAHYVESFEPYVPWSKRFLNYRVKVYQDAGHPLAVKADQDLLDFLRAETSVPVMAGLPRSSIGR
jgi:predicted membrane-bound spermidine synthase